MKPDFDKYTQTKQNVSQSNVTTPTVCECSFEIVTKSMKPDFDKYTQTKQNVPQSNVTPTVCECSFEIVTLSQ